MATRLAVQHVANRGKVATEREAVNIFARPWLPQQPLVERRLDKRVVESRCSRTDFTVVVSAAASRAAAFNIKVRGDLQPLFYQNADPASVRN